ncbi:DgyrCDS9964 [Dimorphilus gyrociliatus]|uniref:DgyrCDS9964 n=1 Tax=Dimorphilus gyrociliatus TaxID=2664684 RepID=A0A7I8VYX2_9ANNE|nr:DgyrCDS9964 [Dimorphilus gyrociliatus]
MTNLYKLLVVCVLFEIVSTQCNKVGVYNFNDGTTLYLKSNKWETRCAEGYTEDLTATTINWCGKSHQVRLCHAWRRTFECETLPEVENGNWEFSCTQENGELKCLRQPNSIGSQVTYECDPGYELNGNINLKCTSSGWSSVPPTCQKRVSTPSAGIPETFTGQSLTIIVSVAFGLLTVLVAIILGVFFKYHKQCGPTEGTIPSEPPTPSNPYSNGLPYETDLDRLALMAFADIPSVHGRQPPTYEEAVSNRLSNNRNRQITNIRRDRPNLLRDNTSIASGETVNVSDATSTTVTVDTVETRSSNPSLSQRVAVGSLCSISPEPSIAPSIGDALVEEGLQVRSNSPCSLISKDSREHPKFNV